METISLKVNYKDKNIIIGKGIKKQSQIIQELAKRFNQIPVIKGNLQFQYQDQAASLKEAYQCALKSSKKSLKVKVYEIKNFDQTVSINMGQSNFIDELSNSMIQKPSKFVTQEQKPLLKEKEQNKALFKVNWDFQSEQQDQSQIIQNLINNKNNNTFLLLAQQKSQHKDLTKKQNQKPEQTKIQKIQNIIKITKSSFNQSDSQSSEISGHPDINQIHDVIEDQIQNQHQIDNKDQIKQQDISNQSLKRQIQDLKVENKQLNKKYVKLQNKFNELNDKFEQYFNIKPQKKQQKSQKFQQKGFKIQQKRQLVLKKNKKSQVQKFSSLSSTSMLPKAQIIQQQQMQEIKVNQTFSPKFVIKNSGKQQWPLNCFIHQKRLGTLHEIKRLNPNEQIQVLLGKQKAIQGINQIKKQYQLFYYDNKGEMIYFGRIFGVFLRVKKESKGKQLSEIQYRSQIQKIKKNSKIFKNTNIIITKLQQMGIDSSNIMESIQFIPDIISTL